MTDTLKPEPVEVTQADREAAKPLLDYLYSPRRPAKAVSERYTQAFARHRLNSSNEYPRLIAALREARWELAHILEGDKPTHATSLVVETIDNLLKESSHGE